MSSFELNKVLGAVLMAVLVMVVIGKIGDNLVTTGGGHGGGHGGDVTMHAKAPAVKVKAPLEPIVGLLASADAAAGNKVATKCRACHDTKKDGKNKIGPNLWNVVNAKRGAVAGFAYSKALTEKPGAWSYESLNAFIAKPKDYVAGTKMSFAGINKVKDRANLIAYLRSAADRPAALPTQAEIDAAARSLEAATNAAAAAAKPAAPAAEAAIKDVAHTAAEAAPAVAKTDIAQMLSSADPERGKKVFAKCKACHTVDKGGKNGIGPNLWNIVNRAPGIAGGFSYSPALKDLTAKPWNFANLNAFLTKPKDYAKGTKMTFAGLKKDGDRAHLIAYLRSLSDSPAPLK
jgi:cytochrome c